ncbi:MAG: hypothetical protein ACOY46_12510 [Bacillota bacterium]
MANNKKNKPKSNVPEKKVFRYWIWLILIGPAIFFALYWLSSGNTGLAPEQKAAIPENYKNIGEAAAVDRGLITAGPGGQVTYSDKLVMGNNTIISEGGTIFAVVPLTIPMDFPDPSKPQWYIAGTGGGKYDLLKVTEKNPAGEEIIKDLPPKSRLVHLIFKVSKEPGEYFLIYSSVNEQAAWKMPPK